MLVNSAFRLAYRIAFPLLRLWWYLRRPEHAGAVVAVWIEDRLLLVRQSYRDRLTFPGGGVARNETPRAAARRELGEEVGLAIDEAALFAVGDWLGWWDYRHDRVSVFELRLDRAPALRLDGREIIDAVLLPREAALAKPLPPFVRAYLENGLRQGGMDMAS